MTSRVLSVLVPPRSTFLSGDVIKPDTTGGRQRGKEGRRDTCLLDSFSPGNPRNEDEEGGGF